MDEFNELYRKFHEVHQSEARTEAEVDGLVAALDLSKGQRLLDLGCGWGVHLQALVARGYGPLVGVEAQGSYLEQAKARLPHDHDVELLEQDARALTVSSEFDAIYCLYNTLFSWDDETHLNILRGAAHALKPGGRFLFDTTNRERVAKSGAQRSWQRPRDLPWLLRETSFDVHTGDQYFTEHYISSDGHVQTQTFKRRHYTLTELVNLFERAGLSVIKRFGALDLSPHTLESPRTIFVAERISEKDTKKGDLV